MAHHKRGRSKNRRAGCLLCKPWKVNGVSTECKEGEAVSDHKHRRFACDGVCDGDEAETPRVSLPLAHMLTSC